MNEAQKRRIEKFISPEDEKTTKELRATSGFVEVGNHPLDRLRRGLRQVFPGMPDLVMTNQEQDDDE